MMDERLEQAHDELEATHWWFEGRRRVIEAVLRRWLRPHPARTLLDVGCGTGGMLPLLARFGQVEGAEASDGARARARAKFPGVPVHPCRLPDRLPDGPYQVVTAFDVLEHVEPAVESLEALAARLAPGGQLVLTVPAAPFLWSRHDELNQHRRRYTWPLLRSQLEAAGLAVQHWSHFNTLLFPAVAAVRLAQRVVPALERGAAADLAPAPLALNRLLTRVLGAEAGVVDRESLPFGVSLIAVASLARR